MTNTRMKENQESDEQRRGEGLQIVLYKVEEEEEEEGLQRRGEGINLRNITNI